MSEKTKVKKLNKEDRICIECKKKFKGFSDEVICDKCWEDDFLFLVRLNKKENNK